MHPIKKKELIKEIDLLWDEFTKPYTSKNRLLLLSQFNKLMKQLR